VFSPPPWERGPRTKHFHRIGKVRNLGLTVKKEKLPHFGSGDEDRENPTRADEVCQATKEGEKSVVPS